MLTMERDPEHIAKTICQLRAMLRLTQENLAQAANLSTRTIEKVESGRHKPDEQTLRSIARGFGGISMDAFRKRTPEEEAHMRRTMLDAFRKMVVVTTRPIHTATDFLSAFDQRHAARLDISEVEDSAALEIAAQMSDWIKDLNDVWDDVYMTDRVNYARSFAEMCQQIGQCGYVCYMGEHKQRLREKGKPDLIFAVNVMKILPKQQAGPRFAIIQLEEPWEAMDDDCRPLPPENQPG